MDPISTVAQSAASTFSPLGAMATGVGDIASSAMSLFGQQRQMDFSRDMASTAHQREVQDLKAAGLNPILSATGGSGASTPSAPALSVPDFSNVGSALTAARSNQISAQQSNTAARQQNSTSALQSSQQDNIDAQTALTKAQTVNLLTQSEALNKLPYLDLQSSQLALKLLGLDVPQASAEASFWSGPGGKVSPWLPAANSAMSLIPANRIMDLLQSTLNRNPRRLGF